MTQTSSKALWTQVDCLSLWPLSLLSGVPDPAGIGVTSAGRQP
jgi:hypothetical protein